MPRRPGLRSLLRVAIATGMAVIAAAAALVAQANFADSAGFSGRAGANCLACHTLAPFPFTPPAATAILAGLPDAWQVGERYDLTIRVDGGPDAMPAPQPQGGFDLAVSAGRLEIPPDFADLLRNPSSDEVTYRPAGTLMREWKTTWIAPDLATQPRPATVWLAVLAANGNHVISTNVSDGGERFDSTASMILIVPPTPEAETAWRALPLAAPTSAARVDGKTAIVEGRHLDQNASALRWRIDGGKWNERETGPDWRLEFPGLSAGTHKVTVQSVGAGRASPEIQSSVEVAGFFSGGGRDTPAPSFFWLAAALAFAFFLRSKQK